MQDPVRMREVERETQQKVNKALSAIEVAIAQWENEPEKTEEMAERIERFRTFHHYFSQWQRMSIIESSIHQDPESTAGRLAQFVELCDQFQRVSGGQ